MRKFYSIIAILSLGILTLTSCGTMAGIGSGQTANTSTNVTTNNNGGSSVLGALLGGIANNSSNSDASLNSESLISGIIGQLTGGKADE